MSYRADYDGDFAGDWFGGPSPLAPMPATNFEGGLGESTRGIVLSGVCTLLSRLLRANGGYLTAIEPLSLQVDGRGSDEDLAIVYDILKGRQPAICVAIGDGTGFFAPGDIASRWAYTLEVHVFFVARSLRSHLAAHTGDATSKADKTADPGLLAMLQHARQLLAGQRPGVNKGGAKELRPVDERQLLADQLEEVWKQSYSVVVDETLRPKRDLTQRATKINARHRLSSQSLGDPPIVTTVTELDDEDA